MDDELIEAIYKLYPWEWLVQREYGRAHRAASEMLWIEPIWKMMWSNKGILPLLKTLDPTTRSCSTPRSSSRTPAATSRSRCSPVRARTSRSSTATASIDICLARTHGEYGEEGLRLSGVLQAPGDRARRLPGDRGMDRRWRACGMGIREDGLITGNTAKFVPHVIEG
jgi:glutathionylspermidine synthase